jgi:hypothetical protein
VGPELARLDHHTEVRSERHTASDESQGDSRARSTRGGRFSRRRERVKLPFEVMTLDVALLLTLALNGDDGR